MQTIVSKPAQEIKGNIERLVNPRQEKKVKKCGQKKIQKKPLQTILQIGNHNTFKQMELIN